MLYGVRPLLRKIRYLRNAGPSTYCELGLNLDYYRRNFHKSSVLYRILGKIIGRITPENCSAIIQVLKDHTKVFIIIIIINTQMVAVARGPWASHSEDRAEP